MANIAPNLAQLAKKINAEHAASLVAARTCTDDIQQQLRDAIAASGRSLNQLSQETGVHNAQLSRFVRGQRSLRMETAAVLCRTLGLHLAPLETAAKRPAAKKRRK